MPLFQISVNRTIKKIRMQNFLPCVNITIFKKNIFLFFLKQPHYWQRAKAFLGGKYRGNLGFFLFHLFYFFFLTNPCCPTTMALLWKYQGNSPGIEHMGASAKMLSFIYYVIWHLFSLFLVLVFYSLNQSMFLLVSLESCMLLW